MREKGSKTAMQKLVKSSDYLNIINGLFEKNELRISDNDVAIPNSQIPNKEVTLSTFLRQNFDSQKATDITKWWIKKGSATPKWDLISTCSIDGQRGILLVEAKAHKGELSISKKTLTISSSIENHERIKVAIDDVNTQIEKEVSGINISRDKCYQFSNRVAHAWWLSNQGVPVVLLYLGFLNSHDLNEEEKKKKYKTFTSPKEWNDCFINHAKIVGAEILIDKTIDCGKSSFVTIFRSIEV